jgi:acyl-CoA synthetase (AMP-forming)/AMP-acid ligase II
MGGCGESSRRHFPAAFAYRASQDPGQECLVDVNAGAPTRRWSFGELDRAADEVAAGLAAVGVGSGDRIVLRLRNTGEFLLALLGTLRAGAIAVPTIRQYSADELAFALGDCEAACLIFDDEATSSRSARAAAASPGSTRSRAPSGWARRAPAPSPGRSVTTAAAPCRPSPTPT